MTETVHVFAYSWRTAEDDGFEIEGIFFQHEAACEAMRNFMEQRREIEERYTDHFDEDLVIDDDDYISFGFYGNGYRPDHVWIGQVMTIPVE